MAKPLKEDSAIKLANIIGKLIADVEKLKENFESLSKRCHTTAEIVAVMMNDVTTVSYTHLTLPTICSV